MSFESISVIVSFIVSMLVMVWRFSAMATEFRTAIRHLEDQGKNVSEVPLIVLRLGNLERSVSGFPQALQEIKVLQSQMGSMRSMRAVREGSRPNFNDEDK